MNESVIKIPCVFLCLNVILCCAAGGPAREAAECDGEADGVRVGSGAAQRGSLEKQELP